LGSAYLPLSSERAGFFLDYLIGFVKERDPEALIGLHCCGNTDWKMVFGLEVDIVSFDAYRFGDKLNLVPREIIAFIDRGGLLAFGLVPTSEYRDEIQEEHLYERFISILGGFEEKGLSKDILLKSSLFTPSCGMGPLDEGRAKRIMELTASLSERIHHSR
jgi:hypothetical protein